MISATRLFVGNLPEDTKETDLRTAFSVFGEITTLDLKSKPAPEENKKFAFVSLSASNVDIEACIKHFTNETFNGNRVYVTRARESFLERLQRERDQAQKKDAEKNAPIGNEQLPKKNPVINLGDTLNPRKRKFEQNNHINENNVKEQNNHVNDNYLKQHNNVKNDNYNNINDNFNKRHTENQNDRKVKSHNPYQEKYKYKDHDFSLPAMDTVDGKNITAATEVDKKKFEAEKKRLESMKQKRQEFKQKKMIIKTGLTGVDKVQNKKVKFCDDDDGDSYQPIKNETKVSKNSLFDDDNDSEEEVNFEVKKQFEGVKGQKVLDLQSRYKSDKRFTLDERFMDEEGDDNEHLEGTDETVELGTADEKAKQLNILQDVLGVTIKQRASESDLKKNKPRLGMVRFDPLQQEHAKFLAPVEAKPESIKKSKKKGKDKDKQEETQEEPPKPEGPKVEVSKEQFYKISDTLKEAIAQPTTFSLRSLFGSKEIEDDAPQNQDEDYISLEAPKPKEKKKRNPMDPTERNPFVYDSSDSEAEEPEKEVKKDVEAPVAEVKAVWKENLFFTEFDTRLKEGLLFFSKSPDTEVQKERRELKSLMKKRIYNKDRKNQMFKKKIGGKRKSMKKPYKNKG